MLPISESKHSKQDKTANTCIKEQDTPRAMGWRDSRLVTPRAGRPCRRKQEKFTIACVRERGKKGPLNTESGSSKRCTHAIKTPLTDSLPQPVQKYSLPMPAEMFPLGSVSKLLTAALLRQSQGYGPMVPVVYWYTCVAGNVFSTVGKMYILHNVFLDGPLLPVLCVDIIHKTRGCHAA